MLYEVITDGRGQSVIEFAACLSGPFAAQQFHLDQAHGIDVRIAQLQGMGQVIV